MANLPIRRVSTTVIVALLVLAACGGQRTSTTTVRSSPYRDAACVCRLPSDDMLGCCRHGMELACRCAGVGACALMSTGRHC